MSNTEYGNKDILAKLIADSCAEVEVKGQKIPMRAPSPKEYNKLVDQAGNMQAEGKDVSVGDTLRFYIACVAATTGYSQDEAGQLFSLSGGLSGDLAIKAMELCGFRSFGNLTEKQEDDPAFS